MAIQAQVYSENIGFSLGGGSQEYMDNAFGFGFGLNECCFDFQRHQQQLQNLQQKNQSFCFQNGVLIPIYNGAHNHLAFSQSIAAQIQKQKQETDRFISMQNERLRLALLEQRKQQLGTILKCLESKTELLLGQKDEEIAKALTRKLELENLLKSMKIESQTWHRVAKEKEAMVISLNNTIEELKESGRLSTNGFVVEDEESCGYNMTEDEGEKKTTVGNRGYEAVQESEEQRTRYMTCKSCNSGNSCIILLPCRHLCSCKSCEAFLDSCPVCGMVKDGSIEALI